MQQQERSLGERIRRVRSHFGLRQEAFGAKIGISGNRVSELEHDKGGTNANVLEAISREFPVEPAWLLRGTGSMLKHEHPSPAGLERLDGRLAELEARMERILPMRLAGEESAEMVKVPLFSSMVPAGAPATAGDEVEEYLEFPASWTHGSKEVFALKVSGDSMVDAGIMPGDTLMVESRQTARDGQVVIASVDSEVTVKTLCISSTGAVSLVPQNRRYRPIPITAETDFRILGVVLAALRQYK